MKKIAVGDLGEFWYGDYKEPFEQLEGGVPGHPVGVVLKADDGKLLCAYCGKVCDNLGLHAYRVHGLTAREYKQETGLLQKSALVSERVRQTHIARQLRRAHDPNRSMSAPLAALAAHPELRGRRPAGNPEHQNKTGRCHAQVLAVARMLAKGDKLSYRSLAARGIYQDTVALHFGDLNALRKVVGLGPRPHNRWSDEAMRVALVSLARRLGRTPTKSDLRRYGLPQATVYAAHFGSYVNACRAAGLDPNLPVPMTAETEVAILAAYATTGRMRDVMAILGMGEHRVQRVFQRYGFPFPPGYAGPGRREWAADMARSLAGTAQEAA